MKERCIYGRIFHFHWSALIIFGMLTGFYNPSVAPFKRKAVSFPVLRARVGSISGNILEITSEELTGRTIGGVTCHTNCLSGSTPTGNLAMTNNQVKYIDKLMYPLVRVKPKSGYAK